MSDRTTSTAAREASSADDATMRTAIAEKEKKAPLKEITRLSSVFSNEDFIKRLEQAVPKQLTPNRMLRSLVGSVQRSPDLLKCGILDVVGKMLVCASAGLETDTPLGHAHLIPFKKRMKNRKTNQWEETFVCNVIFGYHGLLDLSYRTGMLATVNARCVWKKEEDARAFSFEFGTQRHLRHRPMGGNYDLSPEAQAAGKADWPAYAYAHATMKDGYGDPFEVMNWSDVAAVRDKAQAYMAAKRALEAGMKASQPYIPLTWSEAPWVRHVRPMAAKTAFRNLSNWLPRSIEIATVNAVEDAQERGAVDFGMVIDSTDYMAAAAEVSSDGGGAAFGLRGEEEPPEDDADASLGTKQPLGPVHQQGGGAPRQSEANDAPKPQQSVAGAAGPTQGQQQPPAGQTPAPRAPLAGTAPAFEGGATDGVGEPIFDVGRDGLFDTPIAWAGWFAIAARNTTNIEALFENNSDAAGDAARFDPEAGTMIMDALAQARARLAPAASGSAPSEMGEKTDMPAPDASPQPEPVPKTAAGKPAWGQYWPGIKTKLHAMRTIAELDAWEALNEPVYRESKTISATAAQFLAERRAALTPKPDTDAVWAAEAAEAAKKFPSRQAIMDWVKDTAINVRMKRFERERPELYAMVDNALAERLAEIEAGRMEG